MVDKNFNVEPEEVLELKIRLEDFGSDSTGHVLDIFLQNNHKSVVWIYLAVTHHQYLFKTDANIVSAPVIGVDGLWFWTVSIRSNKDVPVGLGTRIMCLVMFFMFNANGRFVFNTWTITTQLNTRLTRDFVFYHKRAETVLKTFSIVRRAPPRHTLAWF